MFFLGDETYELFVTKSFDGVEAGRFGRGPNAKDEAYAHGYREADDHGPGRNHRPKGTHDGAADQNADKSAGAGQRHGFKQKLPGNIFSACADGLADAYFASALGDRDQHDIHHAHAANEQADRAEHHDGKHHAADDVVKLLYNFHLSLNREIIGLVVGHIATTAQDFFDLVHGGIESSRIGEEAVSNFITSRVELHEGEIGNDRPAVFIVGAKTAGGLFENTHDLIGGTIHQNFLTERIINGGEKGFGDIFADDHDIFAVFIFRFGEKTSGFHGGVGIDGEVSRKSAAKIGAFNNIALIARDVGQLPLKRGNGNFLHRGA